MYRKITQEKPLKRYKCFQAPMDIIYPLLNGTAPCHKRSQIVMHFIQKLQGGNSNGTY